MLAAESHITPNISAPGQTITFNRFTASPDSTIYIWGGGPLNIGDGGPLIIGCSNQFSETNQDIVSNDTFAFVINQDEGLVVYDLTKGIDFGQVASIKLPRINDLELQNNIVYALGRFSLQIIDVANPLKSLLTNPVNLPGSDHYIDVQGSYAYVTDDNHGLIIIDISDPFGAFIVSFAKESNTFLTHFKDIKVKQNYAYLIDAENLYIVNISNATRSELIAVLPIQGNLNKIAVHEQYIYITGDIDLQVVDISNPSLPQLFDSHQILNGGGATEAFTAVKPGTTEEIFIHQNRVYATHSLGGIEVFDIKESGKVKFWTLLATIGVSHFVSISNNNFITSTTCGVQTINVHSVAPSSESGRIQVPEKFGEIDIGKNHAFVSAGGFLSIYNISNLQDIDLTAQLNLTCNPTELQFNNDHVYLTGNEKTLQIVDVSDTSSPKLIAEIDKSGAGISLDIQENLLAVIDEKLGLLLFNIAEPDSPELLSMTAIDKRLNDIKIFGHYFLSVLMKN